MTARIVTSSFPTPWGDHHQAWDDRMGADTSPIGNGKTKADAVADLQDMLDDMAMYHHPVRVIACGLIAAVVMWAVVGGVMGVA